ncbi:MAG: aldolase/citrate lyase family protein [Propionibacteriaceae bacterium]
MDKPIRSMLFVPGSNAAMLSTVQVYNADSYMFDLEDAVALREKDTARFLVAQAIQSPIWRDTPIVVRINAMDTPFYRDDIEAMVKAGAHTLRLAMTQNAEMIQQLDADLTELERKYGREIGSTKIMAAIESVEGVNNAIAIAKASPRLNAMALAAFDYVISLHTSRGNGDELLYARYVLLHAARAAGIRVYDAVYGDVNDEEGFIREAEFAKSLGFDGKSLVNPRQIEPLHNVYAPTEAQLTYAQLVIAAADQAERDGLGVVSLNGKMIDAPIIADAIRIVALGAAGVKKEH